MLIKNSRTDNMDIIAVAFDMADMVKLFYLKARMFYYSVILLGHNCPDSGPFSCFLELNPLKSLKNQKK
jgi:hypothetical protein